MFSSANHVIPRLSTISERGGPRFRTFTTPRQPPRQLDPGPVRHPEMMWLHWTLNLLSVSWIIEFIQLHPVVLQPVPPQDQFPTEEAYHHFRDFRIILLELGILQDRVDTALRQVQEIPHNELAAITRTWHQANIRYMDAFSRSGPALRDPPDHQLPQARPPIAPPRDDIRLQPAPQHGEALVQPPHTSRARSRAPPARTEDSSTSTRWTTSSRTTSHSASPAGRDGLHASLWQATHGRRNLLTST